jgi:hypothetical protein
MRPRYGLWSMKLYATVVAHVQATDVLRAPRFLDKLRRAFGGRPDLRTGKMRSAIEATALVEAVRDALRRVGATNAISLVIDDTVLFHDREGKPDDLGDLFLAFAENESVFGQGFEELRLAVEHREAGLHLVIETQSRPVHAPTAPAIRIIVSGRIEALTPKAGEDADSYRKRAEPVASDPTALEVYRMQFEAFAQRLRDAVAAAMPTATVEIQSAGVRIVRPDPERPAEQVQPPSAAYYDPYVAYYPNPLGFVPEMLIWSTLFSMATPPNYVVVDHANHLQGFVDDPGIQSGPTHAAADDGGNWWGDDQTRGTAEDHAGSDGVDGGSDGWGGDVGGGDLGSGDVGGGDVGGGDVGGGDVGGGDVGGGDVGSGDW